MGTVDKAAVGWTIAIVIFGVGIATLGSSLNDNTNDYMMMEEKVEKKDTMMDKEMMKDEDMMMKDKEMTTMEKMMEQDRMTSMGEDMMMDKEMMMEENMMMMDKEMTTIEKMMEQDRMTSMEEDMMMKDEDMMMDKEMMKDEDMMMDKEMMMMKAVVTIPRDTSIPGCETSDECYIPSEASTSIGGSITWENLDTAVHTVTSGTPTSGPNGLFDSGLITSGKTYTAEFNEFGTYEYFCLVHPWMVGTVSIN